MDLESKGSARPFPGIGEAREVLPFHLGPIG